MNETVTIVFKSGAVIAYECNNKDWIIKNIQKSSKKLQDKVSGSIQMAHFDDIPMSICVSNVDMVF